MARIQTEVSMEETLRALLGIISYMEDDDLKRADLDEIDLEEIANVGTFEEAGIHTSERGLLIRTRTGEEYQLTIKRSR